MKLPACFVLMLLALAGPILRAATVTWTGVAGDGSWHTAANWDGGGVPGEDDDVVLGSGDDLISFTEGTNTVRSLTANSRAFAMNGGQLTVTGQAIFRFGEIQLGNGNLAAAVDAVGASLRFGANPSVPVHFICRTDASSGTECSLTGDIGANVTVTVRGTSGRAGGLRYAADIANDGTVILDSVEKASDATLRAVTSGVRFVNRGTLLARRGTGGTRGLLGEGVFENAGTVELEAGAAMRVEGRFNHSGRLVVSDTAEFTKEFGVFAQLGGANVGSVQLVGAALQLGKNPSVPVHFICRTDVSSGTECSLAGDIGANVTVTVLGTSGRAGGLRYATDVTSDGTLILDSIEKVSDASLKAVSSGVRFVNRGTLVARRGTGGSRKLLGDGVFENPGVVELEPGVDVQAEGDFSQSGRLMVPDTARFTKQFGVFAQLGGNNSGTVQIEGATLRFGANPGSPAVFVCRTEARSGIECSLAGNLGSNVTVAVLGTAARAGSLSFAANVTNDGTLILDAVETAADASLRALTGGARFLNRGTLVGRLGTGGTRSLLGDGVFENAGLVELDAGLEMFAEGGFAHAGRLIVPATARFTKRFGTLSQLGGRNDGVVRILGAELRLGANPTVPAHFICQTEPASGTQCSLAGSIGANVTVTVLGTAARAGVLGFAADVTNHGTLVLDSIETATGASLVANSAGSRLVNRGTFAVRQGTGGLRNLSGGFENEGHLWLGDTVLTLSGSSILNAAGGAVTGSGRIVVASLFQNDGTIAPGASPGRLELVGTFLQSATGRLNLQLAGVQAGTGYDQFAVTGDATLGGTLNLGLDDAFDPIPGDLFRLLSAGRRLGEFGTVNLPTLPPGRALVGQYLASGFEVKAEGDPAAIAPRIDAQPPDAEVFPGATVTVSVLAAGTKPLTYQWRKNGVNLAGETRPTLTRAGVLSADGGSYTVIVANEFGALESDPAELRVILDPLPFADNMANRGLIGDVAGEGSGFNRFATQEPGEMRHAGKMGQHSIWLGWRAPQSGLATFRTTGSSFDTLLAVYTGTVIGDLVEVASDEDRGGFLTSEVRFNAVAGVEYLIAVDGFAGASGDIVLGWELVPTVEQFPVVTLQPVGKVAVAGEAVTLIAAATPANAALQWFANGQPLAGATGATLQLPAVTAEQAGSYRLRVTAPNGLVAESQDALVEVSATTGPVAFSADKLEDLFLDDVAARGGIAPAGRPRLHGFTSLSAGSLAFNTRGAFTAPSEPLLCGGLGGASRWFRFRVQAAGDVTLGTTNTAFDTMVAVFTNRFALTPVACNDDVIFGLKNSGVKFRVEPGVDYLVVVDGKDGDAGACTLTWKTGEAVPLLGNVLYLGVSDGHFRFEQEAANGPWELAAADAFANWTSVLRTNVTDGVFRYTDPAPAERPARFYRLAPPAP